MSPAIILDQVSKVFSHAQRPALAETSLEIETGQLVTILGGSGSGKTTLLRLVNRLIEPSSGRILIHGEDYRAMPAAQLRRQIGYVIQQGGLFPHMTVADNIAVVPRLLGWSRSRIQQRVDETLHLMALDPSIYRTRYPRQLSGGQQQRVGLARALAGEPAILLMDEPFGALDTITRANLQQEIQRLHRQLQTTILFVTHDIQEALKLGERVLILNEGRLQQYDTPHRVLTRPANDFVASLVDTGNLYRQLQFIQAKTVMHPATSAENQKGLARIYEDQSLGDALTVLLDSPHETVLVANAQNWITGYIDLHTLRALRREAD